jgi:hypothetical protein
MTREEAKAEIRKVFEPAFANYIITALTEGATPSECKTFPKFKVIDNNTGKEPDLEDIVLNEEWAYMSNLVHCDMEGFAITNNGDLIMLDECGNYEFCPQGRFTVIEGSDSDAVD